MSQPVGPSGITVSHEIPLPEGSTVIIIQLTITDALNNMNKAVPPTVQEKYNHIYMLIASISAILMIVFIVSVSVLIPSPTTFQLRVWLALLALASAALSGTITGMINLKAKIGTQLTIGAAGAFAVLILFYLFNPAVL